MYKTKACNTNALRQFHSQLVEVSLNIYEVVSMAHHQKRIYSTQEEGQLFMNIKDPAN